MRETTNNFFIEFHKTLQKDLDFYDSRDTIDGKNYRNLHEILFQKIEIEICSQLRQQLNLKQ